MATPSGFDHEQLDVYQVAIQALARAALLTRRLPYEDRFLRGQLLRAVTSICFNLAEGIGEFSAGDRIRFLRMSRRSSTEAAAVVDALEIMQYVKPAAAAELKELLRRVCAMLTRMILRERAGRDVGTST